MSIFIPNRSIKLPKDISVPQSLSPSVFETHRRDQAFQMSKRFDGALIDVVSGAKSTSVISGVRYGIVNGVVTEFGVNQPAMEDDGLRGCPAFTQYFLNNEVPVTQSITLAAGSYCLWIEGTGSATFNGLTATEGVPKLFTLASSFTGNCVISGTITKVMLNSGLFPAPFSPTQGTVKSFVPETGSATNGTIFDLDDVKLSRIKAALRGPNAQGHLELTFKSNFDSGWIPNDTIVNILSTNNANTSKAPLYFSKNSSGLLYFEGSDDLAWMNVIIPSVSVGQIFKISIDYGSHSTGQKMRLTVNGVRSSLRDFSGSFGAQDLRFFFGNPFRAGWIVKDSLKVMDRPQW